VIVSAEGRLNYIGSKWSLLPVIGRLLDEKSLRGGVFCDLFAGTTAVGQFAKRRGFQVVSNDWQHYSYVLGRAFLSNNSYPTFSRLFEAYPKLAAIKTGVLNQPPLPLFDKATEMTTRLPLYQVTNWLNQLTGREDGFVYRHYCAGSGSQRNYFSDENGQRCDAIRGQLEEWQMASLLTGDEYYLLLASLLEAVDRVANTASVYAAFLKHIKTTARKPLRLAPLPVIESSLNHKIYCSDANELTRQMECEVLYLDPPYNHRQYATNYHILETIAVGDSPQLAGKTGLRPYANQRSRYCLKTEAHHAFTELVKQAQAHHIILSYNDEGLLSAEELQHIFQQRGTCEVRRLPYKRFRADKDRENRCYAPNKAVNELLFYVRIEDQAEWAA